MMNKTILCGHLGATPTLNKTASGRSVTTLRVACNEQWTDNNGEKQSSVFWGRVVVWGRNAENCCKFLEKGRAVMVEGKLSNRNWADDKGTVHYTSEVIAQSVQFLGNNQNGNQNRVTSETVEDQNEQLFAQQTEETTEETVQKLQTGDIRF